MHVYCWDLDRTYLDTDIHSMRGMVRAALERPKDKRNVPGAPALLRSLQAHDPSSIATVVSGSPTQMRAALAEKLRLDGVRVDRLTLKDNLRNIRRGRLRAVRGQLGYKLPHLLAQRLTRAPTDIETLFGDDAEVDALIYTVYAEVLAGRTTDDELAAVLTAGGAYEDQIEHALRSARHLPRAEAVQDIFIHVDRALPLAAFRDLGRHVNVVFSWLQAALVLLERGRLAHAGVDAVAAECVAQDRLHPAEVRALIQDAVRRALVRREVAEEALRASPTLAPWADIISDALAQLDATEPAAPGARDWLGFLRSATPQALAGRGARR
ncbi:MAG TPA: hypothetical protein PKA64_16790 [Myxococcota bacterium]|nr:hypothetical protein [Myxococcota bacterium]